MPASKPSQPELQFRKPESNLIRVRKPTPQEPDLPEIPDEDDLEIGGDDGREEV
jgi:hypothetical protein